MSAKVYKGAQASHGVRFTAGRSAKGSGTRAHTEAKWVLRAGEEGPIGGASLAELEKRLEALGVGR